MQRQRRRAVTAERKAVDRVLLPATELRQAPGVERDGLLGGNCAGATRRAGRRSNGPADASDGSNRARTATIFMVGATPI
jgi:hypothetical protein